MPLLAQFPHSNGMHPGYTMAQRSPNIIANGLPVLINPTWKCNHVDPPHPSGRMVPDTITARVFFNGVGAGWVTRSVAPCTAVITNGCTNVFVG